jgi:hypothetical protein
MLAPAVRDDRGRHRRGRRNHGRRRLRSRRRGRLRAGRQCESRDESGRAERPACRDKTHVSPPRVESDTLYQPDTQSRAVQDIAIIASSRLFSMGNPTSNYRMSRSRTSVRPPDRRIAGRDPANPDTIRILGFRSDRASEAVGNGLNSRSRRPSFIQNSHCLLENTDLGRAAAISPSSISRIGSGPVHAAWRIQTARPGSGLGGLAHGVENGRHCEDLRQHFRGRRMRRVV